MAAAQLDEAQTRAAAWQPHPVWEVLAMTIDLPAAAGAKRPWPPGLQGRALDRLKEGGDNPAGWQQLPDFAQGGDYRDRGLLRGQRQQTVRRQLPWATQLCRAAGEAQRALGCGARAISAATPGRVGGARDAQGGGDTEQAMRYWVLCASGVESDL